MARDIPTGQTARAASDRLLIPGESFTAAHREIDALLGVFDRVVTHRHAGACARVGIFRHWQIFGGQRAAQGAAPFARTVRRPENSIKFKRDIPYATLAQAFDRRPRPRRSSPHEPAQLLGAWRSVMRSNRRWGRTATLLANLIPELELVIGPQPPLPDLPPKDAQKPLPDGVQTFLAHVFAVDESIRWFCFLMTCSGSTARPSISSNI